MSLLLISSKFFEKIVFNSLFKYLEDNKLITCNQSGFQTGHLCVHQLSKKTQIYRSFDPSLSLELKGV